MGRKLVSLLIASFAAPLIGCTFGALLYSIAHALMAPHQFMPDGPTLTAGLAYGVVYAITLGWPAMALIGIPAHFALRKLNLTNSLSYIVAGAAAGALVVGIVVGSAAIEFGVSYATPTSDALAALPLGLVIGVFIALAFWLIRRPDRDAPPPIPGRAEGEVRGP